MPPRMDFSAFVSMLNLSPVSSTLWFFFFVSPYVFTRWLEIVGEGCGKALISSLKHLYLTTRLQVSAKSIIFPVSGVVSKQPCANESQFCS